MSSWTSRRGKWSGRIANGCILCRGDARGCYQGTNTGAPGQPSYFPLPVQLGRSKPLRKLNPTVMTGGDTLKATCSSSGRRAWTIEAAIVSTCAWFGMSGDTAVAQTEKAEGTPYYAYHNGGAKPMLVSEKPKPKGARISEEEAKKIAVKAVPGTVTGVAIEKKLGANRYVVEVIAADDGAETDVIIEMETGKVLATEK